MPTAVPGVAGSVHLPDAEPVDADKLSQGVVDPHQPGRGLHLLNHQQPFGHVLPDAGVVDAEGLDLVEDLLQLPQPVGGVELRRRTQGEDSDPAGPGSQERRVAVRLADVPLALVGHHHVEGELLYESRQVLDGVFQGSGLLEGCPVLGEVVVVEGLGRGDDEGVVPHLQPLPLLRRDAARDEQGVDAQLLPGEEGLLDA